MYRSFAPWMCSNRLLLTSNATSVSDINNAVVSNPKWKSLKLHLKISLSFSCDKRKASESRFQITFVTSHFRGEMCAWIPDIKRTIRHSRCLPSKEQHQSQKKSERDSTESNLQSLKVELSWKMFLLDLCLCSCVFMCNLRFLFCKQFNSLLAANMLKPITSCKFNILELKAISSILSRSSDWYFAAHFSFNPAEISQVSPPSPRLITEEFSPEILLSFNTDKKHAWKFH